MPETRGVSRCHLGRELLVPGLAREGNADAEHGFDHFPALGNMDRQVVQISAAPALGPEGLVKKRICA